MAKWKVKTFELDSSCVWPYLHSLLLRYFPSVPSLSPAQLSPTRSLSSPCPLAESAGAVGTRSASGTSRFYLNPLDSSRMHCRCWSSQLAAGDVGVLTPCAGVHSHLRVFLGQQLSDLLSVSVFLDCSLCSEPILSGPASALPTPTPPRGWGVALWFSSLPFLCYIFVCSAVFI